MEIIYLRTEYLFLKEYEMLEIKIKNEIEILEFGGCLVTEQWA
jgi:hypothetical protein